MAGLKERLGRRVAARHVRRRAVRTWEPKPEARRVLVVLPAEEEALKAAWRFVQHLGLDARRVTPVMPAAQIAYAPAEYIGRVKILQRGDLNPLGLPKSKVAAEVWADGPDVALCLAPASDLAAAYLAGASPAAFRIGIHSEGAEDFFDLMTGSAESYEAALAALRQVLERLAPPVFPLPSTA